MSKINNERIEVILEECILKLNIIKQKYSLGLSKIDGFSKCRGFDFNRMASGVKKIAHICCQSIIKIVQDQISCVTDKEKQRIYFSQLNCIREDLEQSLEVPFQMSTMKSECNIKKLLLGRR